MLSRLLYLNDEVLYSFLDCLLKKHTLEETYFWICEYYYSGFIDETWEYIFKIYYDFYAIYNPKLEQFLTDNYNIYQTNQSINCILIVVKTLYNSTSSPILFCLRYMESEKPLSIYIGRNPKWLNDLNINEKTHKNLIRSIKDFEWNNMNNFLFYFNKCSNWDKCYNDVILYFKSIIDIKSQAMTLKDIPYENKKHILLATIIHCCIQLKDIKKRKIIYNYNDNGNIIKSFEETIPAYKILKTYRLFHISKDIGGFGLYRFRCNTNVKSILYNWDYYCYKTPIWNDRIKFFNGRQYSFQKTLKFTNVMYSEKFYNKYNYEPDEQDIETQNKSIINIEKTTIKYWLTSIFDNSIYYDNIPKNIIY